MRLKLTKQSVRMLSMHLEKKMTDMGLEYVPEEKLIAIWIADWTKEQMMREAEEMFVNLTVKS